MQLNTLFKKAIDRPIEGVIKADDNASLRIEVEEYILTNEIEKRLEEFLGAYNSYENANGAWISGFFGSGKSHLLKMLALLLENREVDGESTIDRFLPKCGDNEILRGDLTRAAGIPSKSILFNIDQKADIISKVEIDALLGVFVKVFDEMCGYYGKQGHIAQLERDLDQRGLLDAFKSTYAEISGQPWEEGREMAILVADSIDQAYARVAGTQSETTSSIVEKYRSEYRMSIEDFAQQVKDFIDRQVPGFRLNFFVDEVGQYIAESQKLRTNLQTVAESLATKCRGQAWIVVTAQEDMESFFGDQPGQQTNDYSKIQARFKYRMKLTSSDVAEVIQKRLLMKTEESIPSLARLYDAQVNNFKTLFDFADGAQTYRNFRDREHFIQAYPFVPYQFDLFQASIQNLSLHSAFEGKYSSVGERSMLGVFQQVAIGISDCGIGDLAPFHLMFEGIRTALKARIQQAVLTAENNLEDDFAVRVLKALFLVKYIKSFRPTIRNLCVLMMDSFDCDLPALRSAVTDAVNLLEQQTYIQRNGELYEFLTNEEKDIEEEIKNTDVDAASILKELADAIFDRAIKSNKIRFADNKEDYPFTRRLDGQLFGRDHELTIHVISPFHPDRSEDDATIVAQSMGRDELLVLMPNDDRLITDLMMCKRTEKYIRQNLTTTQRESVRRILETKRLQNQERQTQVQERVEGLLGKAELVIGGRKEETRATHPGERIVDGFQHLIRRTYSNLRMLGNATFSESAVGEIIRRKGDPMLAGAESLGEAENEVLSFITRSKTKGMRPTLQLIVETFEKKTYGWPLAAILCCTAKLYTADKIELRADGNVLEDAQVEKALLNSRERGNTFAEPQSVFTNSQIRALKEFFGAFFDRPVQSTEARAAANETRDALRELLAELDQLIQQRARYRFLAALEELIPRLREVSGKPYPFYIEELPSLQDALLALKEDVLDPIRSFMRGEHRKLYDEARSFLDQERTNLDEFDGDEAKRLEAILEDPSCYRGDAMRQAKALVDSLREAVTAGLGQERSKAVEEVRRLQAAACSVPEFSNLPEAKQQAIRAEFEAFERKLAETPLAAVIRDQVARFRTERYPAILQSMLPASGDPGADGGETDKPVQIVTRRELEAGFSKAWLTTKEDVDAYLASLREACAKAIKDGKRIQL
ncbi:BREX system P-loop protein BrxC [Candidatus Bipolaricaulota bacterium]